MNTTVAEIQEMLRNADADEFAALERSLAADTRKGVVNALKAARKRIQAQRKEEQRLEDLYAYERSLAGEEESAVIVGLDEVGRGPLAGPLAVGAVVLPAFPRIAGLNDSKQIKPEARESIASQVKDVALAWAVEYVQPADIDRDGMTASLRRAFSGALAQIEAQGITAHLVLVDGNPLHIDPREVNVVKGDAKCASIAAASVLAKVERDAVMCELAKKYPGYHLDENKGYGSPQHIQAIKDKGLAEVHRKSFCKSFMQESLF